MKASKMRGLLFVLLVLLAPFHILSQISQLYNYPNLQLVNAPINAVQKHKIHPAAQKAIKKGLKPARFKNVRVEFQKNVQILNPALKKRVLPVLQNPVLPDNIFKQTSLQPGKIYVDPETDLVFKPVKITKDTVVLIKPEFDEVFKDIYLPEQSVKINMANTEFTLENTEVKDEGDPNAKYTMRLEFKDTLYHFSKTWKKGSATHKIDLNVHLDGFIGFTDPVITAKYSKNKGYKLVFNAQEKLDLDIKADAKVEEEVSFPIWGYDIPIEDYGSCKIGVFLVLEANGEAHLNIAVEQGLDITAGIKGKTFYYYPRSLKPVFEMNKYFDIDYQVTAKIKAFAGVDLTADMKYKSYDILKLRTRGGAEASAEFDNKDTTNFKAELGAKFLIDGKLKMKSFKKKFELYSKYYLLWKKEVKNYGGYLMVIKDADAYHDRIWGEIYTINNDTLPYMNGEVKIKVQHQGGNISYYTTSTNSEGVYAIENVTLIKGDRVFVKVKASPNWSPPFETTIPFNKIELVYADYYTNKVVGSISSKIDKFPIKSSIHSKPKITGIYNPGNKITQAGISKLSHSIFKPQIKISPEMFKKAITYNGDVNIIIEPVAKEAKLIGMPALNMPNKKKDNRKKYGRYHKKLPAKMINPVLPEKIVPKKATNLPFGMFTVSNIDVKPGDKVKARINIDGFILESDFVISDGLIITPIEYVNFYGGPSSPVIKADNAFTIINAFRSSITPKGKAHLLAGIDMKHTQPVKLYPQQKINIPKLKEFPQAVHPLVFFNKEVNLKAVSEHPGFAKAETGPWQVKNIYYKPRMLASKKPIDGHRFMYVSYPFDGRWTGIKYYQPKCLMCAGGIQNFIFSNSPKFSITPDYKDKFINAAQGIK